MTRQTGEIKESMMHFSSFGVNLWTNWTQTILEFVAILLRFCFVQLDIAENLHI